MNTNCDKCKEEMKFEDGMIYNFDGKPGLLCKKCRPSECNGEWYAGEWCKECHAECGLEGGKK